MPFAVLSIWYEFVFFFSSVLFLSSFSLFRSLCCHPLNPCAVHRFKNRRNYAKQKGTIQFTNSHSIRFLICSLNVQPKWYCVTWSLLLLVWLMVWWCNAMHCDVARPINAYMRITGLPFGVPDIRNELVCYYGRHERGLLLVRIWFIGTFCVSDELLVCTYVCTLTGWPEGIKSWMQTK